MNNSTSTPSIEVLNDYVMKLSEHENVSGIVLTGSIGRGDNDEYSDVDVVVFTGKGKPDFQEGKFDFRGYLFDVRICDLEQVRGMSWSYDMYFAYLNSQIIYDPENAVQQLIADKKKEWQESISAHIILSSVQLSVIFEFEDNWRGLKTKTHYHKFLSREDFLSAHRVLNLGFEFALDLFYLLKGVPPPDYKNKIRLLDTTTNISPKDLHSVGELSLCTSLSYSDAEKRYEVLSTLVRSIRNMVDSSDKLFPEDFYQFYIKNRY
jgi:predicted nucleotidyltransferase